MFRLVLLVACPEEKLITACKRLLSDVQLGAQTRAVVALVSSIDHGPVEQCFQHRHTVLQSFVFRSSTFGFRSSIAQFGDEAGELGGGKLISVIVVGVVTRSGSGRIGSCHADTARVTTKTGRRQLPPGGTPAARVNEGTVEVAPSYGLGAQRQGGGRRVVCPDRRRVDQSRPRG